MKKFLLLLLLCGCVETQEPEDVVSVEEFIRLEAKVSRLQNTVSTVKELAGAFGRELLQFHLPDCVFIQQEDDPLVFWVAKTCNELFDINKDLKDAQTITVQVYRSDNHTHWFWKFKNIEY